MVITFKGVKNSGMTLAAVAEVYEEWIKTTEALGVKKLPDGELECRL